MAEKFGIIGLGKMGGGIALRAMEMGYEVAGFDPSPSFGLAKAGVAFAPTLSDFVKALPKPRRIFLWLPAGPLVDNTCNALAELLEAGDVIVDGGNSYWGDSIRRAEKYRAIQLHLLDLGTSGGIDGARHGPCFMIGGPAAAVKLVEPLLLDLATPGGYVHAGPNGAGHFVKLVHNGIEFGILQAIGEGMELLARFPMPLKIAPTLECWRNGSVIRSWLIDLMARSYAQDPDFRNPSGYIEDTGEVNWLIGDALNLDVPIPVIAQSVMALLRSRETTQVSDKSVIAMRHEFGGHPFGPDPHIRAEREHGKVGPFHRFDSGTEQRH